MRCKLVYIVILSFLVNIFCGGISVMASGNYIALGDSITTGYGLEDSNGSFAELLAEGNGYELFNYAQNGATAKEVLALLTGGTIDDKIKSAQLITLTCGGNDMMNALYKQVADKYNETSDTDIQSNEVLSIVSNPTDSRRTALAMIVLSVLSGSGDGQPAFADSDAFLEALGLYTEQLSSIVSYIRSLNDSANVVVATQYNPYKGFAGIFAALNTGVNTGATKLNEAIVSNADKADYTVADVYTAFENGGISLCNANAAAMNFDVHPNVDGHKVIADCINDVIHNGEADGINHEENIFSISFSDVSEEAWYCDAVGFVSKYRLFNGITETEFYPDAPMSRAMLVTVLYRAEGEPEVSEVNDFTDVAEGAYYERAVSWAKANGIVTGVSETEFAPDDNVTREQIAAIILRYADFKGMAPVGAWAIRLNYADLAEISDYALNGVMYCTMKGIMQGKGENKFAPKDNATRAEFAAVLKNIITAAQ